MKRITSLAWVVGAAVISLTPTGRAVADPIKPRFLIIVDTSGSMSLSPAGTETHGDGSQRHPGCDLDGNASYDDSRLYQAKAALNDTISAFGSAEFALGRYHVTAELNTPCTTDANCPTDTYPYGANPRNWTCGPQGYCAVQHRQGCNNNGTCYDECTVGTGCVNCANPATDPYDLYAVGLECPGTNPAMGFVKSDCIYPGCNGADVVVPFPENSSNYTSLLSWLDGVETFPAGSNKELRAIGSTPIAGSLNAALNWMTSAGATSIGLQPGPKSRDGQAVCRSYNTILITDGAENCDVRGTAMNQDRATGPAAAAAALLAQGIKTYVIGFAVNDPTLDTVAASGGTGTAILANNRSELTAKLGDIIAASIPKPKCDCDSTCDDEAQSFPQKGQPCEIGTGRCKRRGVWGCSDSGDGVVCRTSPTGGQTVCNSPLLTAGTPGTEACGAAPNCPAGLTAGECADENCDGQIDEGLNCTCAQKPELCNGLDDNCNNVPDEGIASVKCGIDIGECEQGDTVCSGGTSSCIGGKGPTPEICDAKDNDCDGITDSFGTSCYPVGFTGCTYNPGNQTWACGGICQTGTSICTSAVPGACSGAITPQTELACDGLDNDCDGQTDEGFNLGAACGPGISGVGQCRPGKYECEGGAVVCKGGLGPGTEICDGVDNDCDGRTDMGLGACGSSLGICKPGQYECVNNQMVCNQPMGPAAETCNGADDDCDGAIDNNLTDPDLVVATACSSNVGVCKAGVLRCVSGKKICDGGVSPQIEVCNNLDDDCDGCVDCDPTCLAGLGKTCPIPGAGQMCGSSEGECRPGALFCVAGMVQCVGGVPPGAEICDRKDNDCNGFTDEADPVLGANCYPDGTSGCNVMAASCTGECRFGANLCDNGGIRCANPVLPAAEICDSKDNDCNGVTDETFDVGAVCDNGATNPNCKKTGSKICNGAGNGTTCSVPPFQAAPEICDGEDNDCDGKTDSDDDDPLPGVGTACGSNVGECRQGVTACVKGKLTCSEVGPTPEICNGLDDDCDGTADDNLLPPAAECPPAGLQPGMAVVGECKPGTFVCARGDDAKWGWQCRGAIGPQMEICDGKDNDCDGVGDDMPLCPAGSACVTGECIPKCNDSEFPCPADRTCKDGYCVKNPCVNVTCPAGQYCDGSGACIDPCAGKTCLSGQTCERGVCVDCHIRGCAAGQVCVDRQCVVDACASANCGPGTYCREGQCIKSCTGVACAVGQRCQDGACVVDACVGVACGASQFCDPATGQCRARTCNVIQCMPGTKCIETTGKCTPDPCLETRCAADDVCVMSVDGLAQCFVNPAKPTADERRVATSGGGLSQCACDLGAANDNGRGGFAGAWVLAGLGAAGVIKRRKRRNKSSDGGKGVGR